MDLAAGFPLWGLQTAWFPHALAVNGPTGCSAVLLRLGATISVVLVFSNQLHRASFTANPLYSALFLGKRLPCMFVCHADNIRGGNMVLELDQLLKYQTIALSVSGYCCRSFSSLPLACPPWSLPPTPGFSGIP